MFKSIFTKTIMLSSSFCAIIVLFGSCAVSKFDYYYTALSTDNPQIKELENDKYRLYEDSYKWINISIYSCNRYSIRSEMDGDSNDSILFITDILASDEKIIIDMQNDRTVYFDYEKSRINFNDTSYKIVPYRHRPDIEVDDKVERCSGCRRSLGYVDFPFSMINHLYEKFSDDSLYKFQKRYTIGSGNTENKRDYRIYSKNMDFTDFKYKTYDISIPAIQFTKEDSPLRINVELVYYTDPEHKNMKTVNFDFYQTALMKLKDMRYDDKEYTTNGYKYDYYKGEIIGLEMDDASFYVRNKTGTIWGWPELRRGLGWTVTWIASPVILPIEIVAGILQRGDGNGAFNIPLFE
jgi:hypothetical protein